MKKYTNYKDSGIEWIGEIPEHWEAIRLCYLGVFSSSGIDKKINPDENLIKIINFTDIYNNSNKTLDSTFNYMVVSTTENKFKEHLVKKGDLIFLPSSETYEDLGTSALVDEELENVSFSYHVIRLSFNVMLEHNFKKYLTNNYPVLNQFSSNGQGTTRKIIGRNVFRNIKVIVPPLQEQTTIANYLDLKTTQIDHLITQKEQLIQLLQEERVAVINQAVTKGLDPTVPMKNSGIEWLGEIPEGWDNPKMKYICEFILDGTHGSFNRVDEGYRLLSVRNIINNKFVFRDDDSMVSQEDFESISKRFLIKKNDIQLAIVGATLGKVAIVEDLVEDIVTQRSLATIRVNTENCNPHYLFYFFLSEKFQTYLWLNAGFSAQPGVYLGTLQNCVVPLPDLNIQNLIIEFIKENSTVIDNIILKTQQEIELLKEYKTALISEVVTGKVDVRDYSKN